MPSVRSKEKILETPFPDLYGKLKWHLIQMLYHATDSEEWQEHYNFYEVALWLQSRFRLEPDDREAHDPDRAAQIEAEQRELDTALDSYVNWFGKSSNAVFVATDKPEEFGDAGISLHRVSFPIALPLELDTEDEDYLEAFGAVPMRYLSGRVCLRDLHSKSLEDKPQIIRHVAAFPATLHHCTHEDPGHVEICTGDCSKCSYFDPVHRATMIHRLPESVWKNLWNRALSQLEREKIIIEDIVWDIIYRAGVEWIGTPFEAEATPKDEEP